MLLTSVQKTSADFGLFAKCMKKLSACCVPFWFSVFSSPALAGSIEELAAGPITKDGMALAAELGMDANAARETDPKSYLGLLIRGFSILGPQRAFAESDFEIKIEVVEKSEGFPALRITHIPTSEIIDFSFKTAVFAAQVTFLNNCLDGVKDLNRYVGSRFTRMSWTGIKKVLTVELADDNPSIVNTIGPTVAGLPGQLQGLVQSSVSALEAVVGSQLDTAASKTGLTGVAARMCQRWWKNGKKP